jgi:predicted dehydrogenase
MLKRAIDDGKFGKVLYVRCQAMRRRGIPNWGVFGRKDLQGGGPLIDLGVHIMEAAHYLMGKPQPIAASGNCYTYIGDKKSNVVSSWPNWDHKTYTVEDLAIGMIRFANGATMVVESSFCAHIEKGMFDMTLMGEKGGGTWEQPKVFTDQSGTMVNLEPSFLESDTQWDQKMTDWIECIRTGRKPICPGEDGVAIQKMLDGIYKSAEVGKEVVIR